MKRESVPECVDCGLCCVGHVVVLDEDDEGRLTADEVIALTELEEHTVFSLRRRLRWGEGQRCIALRVVEGKFLCSIYERRPDACRAFERGARRCLTLLEER